MWSTQSPKGDTLKTVRDIGETQLCRDIFRSFGAPASHIPVGIGDDAAIVSLRNKRCVVSADTLIEDVDFRTRWATPADVGHKAAAVNLSDMAAMGARPRALIASLGLASSTPARHALSLLRALHRTGCHYGAPLVGGDLSETRGPLVVSITVLGDLAGDALLRHRARAGDHICVSGTLGGAALGLFGLENERKVPLRIAQRQLRPTPQVRLAQSLTKRACVRAAVDLSDGLLKDVTALLAPGRGVRLYAERLPIAQNVRRLALQWGLDPTSLALTGGEDFELAIAVAPEQMALAGRVAARLGVILTSVGEVTREPGVVVSGLPVALTGQGFSHFSG